MNLIPGLLTLAGKFCHGWLVWVFLIVGLPGLSSAREGSFIQAEDSLTRMALAIVEPLEDEGRMERAAVFSGYLQQVLGAEGSFHYAFDSLKTVSRLMAPDSSFRIMTWYVPLSQQRFRYFGLVQQPGENGQSMLIWLHDQSDTIRHPLSSQHRADAWYGAWYYALIQPENPDESDKESRYILLGWKGDNPQTRIRLVEPFRIEDDGPVFGAQVFYQARGNPFRVLFEYSARASMNLSYEEKLPDESGQLRPTIVFDRLVPVSEIMRGQREYYIPEGERVDALVFKHGYWHFVPDFDIHPIRAR